MNLGGIEVVRVAFPYRHVRSVPDLRTWIPGPGEIVLLDLAGDDVTFEHVRNVVRSIRLDIPVAVGIRLTSPEIGRALRMASCISGARVLVVDDLGDNQHLYAALHESFGCSFDLSREVAEWFRMTLGLSRSEAAWLDEFCRASLGVRSVGEVHESLNEPERTVRARMARSRLPNPERWYNLVRLVDVQYRMLQYPLLTVARAARDAGYTSAQGLDNAIRRSFGVSAARSRDLLGIEWRLHAWSERLRVNARRQDSAASRVAVCASGQQRQTPVENTPPETLTPAGNGARYRIHPARRDFP